MTDSVFTKIVKGELPSYKIYEDDKTLAFLDIHPIQPGHTLVIPKQQVEFIWDLNPEIYAAVMNTVKKVAQHLRATLGVKYVGALVEGVDVPHAHVKLVPFNTVEEYKAPQVAGAEPDHTSLADMAKKLNMQDVIES